jgi:4-hydroxy-tetrahydrodipicolinate synthase
MSVLFIMSIKNGVYVALVTPFTKNNTVCWSSLEKLVNFHIEKKTTGLVLLGTTGESPTLTNIEKIDIIDYVYKKADKKIDIVVGVGGNNTEEVKHFALYCQNKGVADSLMVTVPNYNKPTQEGIYQHFKQIADYVILPIMMYNIPSRCGVNMEPETIFRLSKIDNIVGIKEASGSLTQIHKINTLVKDDNFKIFSGDDALIIPIMSLGGCGVVSVIGNILPDIVLQIVNLCLDNNFKDASKLYYEYHEKIENLFIETNPIPVKEILFQKNMIENNYRLPLLKSSKSELLKLLNY